MQEQNYQTDLLALTPQGIIREKHNTKKLAALMF